MDFKRTKLTVLITTIIATGCSANKLDSSQDYCQNGGASSDYSCNAKRQKPVANNKVTADNPNTEAWMNSKLSDIKSWLKTIKENPDAAMAKPAPSNTSIPVRNPAATNPYLMRIEALSQAGDHRSAMAAINTFLAGHPNNLEAELTKGLILNNMGQAGKAETLLRSAISRHPTSPELYNNLAVLYSNDGNYGKAIETLLLAFSTDPSYAQVNENLREVYASVASLAYNRALDLNANKKLRPKLIVLRRTSVPSLPAIANTSLNSQLVSNSPTVKDSNIDTLQTAASQDTSMLTAKQSAAEITDSKPKIIIAKAGKQISLPLPRLQDSQPEPDIATLSLKRKKTVPTKTSSIVRIDNNTPKKTAKAPGRSTLAAIKAVDRWTWTWSSQNVNAYLGSYIEGYQPKARVSNQAWRKLRTARLTKPSSIKVKLSNIKSTRISSSLVEVTFLQKYQANDYKDQTNKRLTLQKIGTRWLIIKEKNI